MSTYSEKYQKMIAGYNKIISCIDSIEYPEHLECVPTIVENWVNLLETYEDNIYRDRRNRNRKKDAERFAEAATEMFKDINEVYNQRVCELAPVEYTGVSQPVRIRGIQEIAHGYE